MQFQEDESLGTQSQETKEDTCTMTFTSSAQRGFETDEEKQRCSGVERPMRATTEEQASKQANAIRCCSSYDHDSVPWYDSVDYIDAASDFWSINYALETTRLRFDAFVTECAEEKRRRALRGHLMLHFGNGWPIRRCFPFYGPVSRPRGLFGIVDGKRVLARHRSITSSRLPTRSLPALHAARLRDSWCGTEDARAQRPRYAGVQLIHPKSTPTRVGVGNSIVA
ncbi:hypothetical protein MRX96_008063 [Rhipicephalus microplus]